MYRLTETEKKAPDYSYTEEFETQEEAYNRMMDLYHSFAIDTDANAVVTAVLGFKSHWGVDLNEFDGVNEYVTASLEAILAKGIREAIKEIVD
jgi:tagaturonate reductase